MDDDVPPNAYGSGFDIVPSVPNSLDAVQRHEQAVAQVAAMDPRVASEVYQEMLNSGGSVTLQEAAQATLAGMPSATVAGAPTVNNLLAMTRLNVVNLNASPNDEELRRELQQHEFLLSEQARREAEIEALRFRSIYEREASESIAATKAAAEQAMLNVQQRAQQQEQSVQQMVQQQDNVAIKRLQGTLEEQREHFQQRLAQATAAHEKVVQEKNAMAEEGNAFVDKMRTEHHQYVEQQEAKLKAAVEAKDQARHSSAEESRIAIELDFKREQLDSSLAIAQAKIKTLVKEMEATNKQHRVDRETQEQTIVELRKDNAMLKGEMDELRRVVQSLTDREEERKEAERKAQSSSPVKPGPQYPEPFTPPARQDAHPIGQPQSFEPLRTEGTVPATLDGKPLDKGGSPIKTAMDATASVRNTGFPSMFSGTGAPAAEQATASTDRQQFKQPDPWTEYMRKSTQYNFSDDPLYKSSFNQEATKTKDDRREEGPASQVRTPQDQDLGEIIKKALLEGFKGAKSKDSDKPKAKEADKIDLPEFPSPDRYRTWRAAVREAIRSASDDPDAAFAWVLEVYAVREDKAKLCSELADPGKFRTLDTKLLAALTKVAKGELSQQILNYKESEAQQGRIVRGRQVLLMFEVHFKTSEEAGALYGTEDLLKISLDSDDLKSFLRKWESVLTGMSHVPDPATLKDLFYREVRKSRKLRFDLDVYERAPEGSNDRSYEFLINSVRRYLDRERLRTNREKISQSHAAKFANPAPHDKRTRSPSYGKRSTKGDGSNQCYEYAKTGKCKYGSKCKYSHDSSARPRSLSRESSRSRSASPSSRSSFRSSRSRSSSRHTSRSSSRNSSRSSSRGRKSDKPCRFFAKGNCKRGDKCPFKHGDTATPAPRRRSPSPAAKRSKDKKSKKDKKDKKSKREKKDKSPKASPCIQTGFAMSCLAATATRTQKSKDYWEFSKDGNELIRHHLKPRHRSFLPTRKSCPVESSRLEDQFTMVVTDSKGKSRTIKGNWKKHPNAKQKFDWTGKSIFRVVQEKRIRFELEPEVHTFPVWKEMYRHVVNKSKKRNLFRTTEECPKSRECDTKDAILAAESLRQMLVSMDTEEPACDFLCEHSPEGPDDLCCAKCRTVVGEQVPSCARLTAMPNMVGMEKWLGDTGTDQDIVGKDSKTVNRATKIFKSNEPISLTTANGPITADEVVEVILPGLCESFNPYILQSTPSALSIGVRCLEQGYDFVWGKDTTPIFLRPDGQCVKFKLQGRVPYIDETCTPFSIPESLRTRLTKVLDSIHQFTIDQGYAMASHESEPEEDQEEADEAGVDANADDGQEDEEDSDPEVEVPFDFEDVPVAGEKTEEQLRKEAKSGEHQFTHRPKNPYCDVCSEAKMLAPYGRSVGGSQHVLARGFGDHIVCDHVIPKDIEEGIEGQTSMLVIKDIYTQYRCVYPSENKTADSIVKAFKHFLKTSDIVGIVYTDNAPEMLDAIEELGFKHQTSVEYQHSTKAVVEREVRTILEGARSNLLQANMPLSLWPYASKHHAMAINIVKQLNGGDPPWALRFDNGFLGRQLPFGCLLFFWEGKYEPKRGKFAPNAKRGVFLGYNIQAGHVWRGEYLVANVDSLEYFLKEGHLKTIRTKRVALPDGDFIFPLHFKEKPILDLQDLDYQPEADDDDDDDDAPQDDGPPDPRSGAPEGEADVPEIAVEEPASVEAEPPKEKGKEKKEREPTLFELYYDPSVNPHMFPDGKPVPKGYVYDGVRLVKERKGSKRVPGFPTDLWQNLSHKQRKKAWDDYQSELEEKRKKEEAEAVEKASIEGSPSETPPAMVAAPAMPVEHNVYEPHRSDMRQLVEDKIKELTDEANASLFAAVVQLLVKPKFQSCFAAVAKVLNKKEIAASKEAQASLDKEWDKLLNKKTWNQERVKECRRVVDEARRKGEKVHIGRIFEICTLKGSELPEGNPQRKYKGRSCFQGNNVFDENSDYAIFSEMSSSPASMEAAKILDAFGSQPGYSKEQADARQAYTQAAFTGVPTWLRLPKDRWPKGWKGKYNDPLVPMLLALYGHPDSGGIWEAYFEKQIGKKGWQSVLKEIWRSVFYHPEFDALLVVYVDDLKLAAPTKKIKTAWKSISSMIDIDEPEPFNRYFGCEHREERNIKLDIKEHPFYDIFSTGKSVAAQTRTEDYWSYDEEQNTYTRHHVYPRKRRFVPVDQGLTVPCQHFLELRTTIKDNEDTEVQDDWTVNGAFNEGGWWTGKTVFQCCPNRQAEIDYPEGYAMAGKKKTGVRNKTSAKQAARAQKFTNMSDLPVVKGECMRKQVNCVYYDMHDFLSSCVDAYCDLAKVKRKDLRKASTPFHELRIARPRENEEQPEGRLKGIASRILMKVLFAARMARYDLLRATQSLASRVTKWSPDCDAGLHRLISYINCSLDMTMRGFMGDKFSECQLWLFADADFAGEYDNKSTTGTFMALVGPNTYWPINAFSKKQTATAMSSTEAEVVAANHAVRAQGLPSLSLFNYLIAMSDPKCPPQAKTRRAGVAAKPKAPTLHEPVSIARIDRELDELRYGFLHDGPESVANVNHLQVRLGPCFTIRFMEDNQATITILSNGNSVNMRHTDRTQRVSFSWLKETFDSDQFDLINVNTLHQAADVLTKPFTSPQKWNSALYMLNMVPYTYKQPKSKGNSLAVTPSRGDPVQYFDISTPDNSDNEELDQGGNALPSQQPKTKQRLMVEWCCSPDSKLGQQRAASKGCTVFRVTENEDATTRKCVEQMTQKTIQFWKENGKCNVHVHISLPCTGGCPWNNVNKDLPGGKERIQQHQKKFAALLKNADKFLEGISVVKPTISFELPSFCEYWKWKSVKNFKRKYRLVDYKLHGCQVGVTDEHGTPIKKGWTVASDIEAFAALEQLRCDGQHVHAQSRGKALRDAEGYTFKLTDKIHTMFRNLCSRVYAQPCTEEPTVHAACATTTHTRTCTHTHTHTHTYSTYHLHHSHIHHTTSTRRHSSRTKVLLRSLASRAVGASLAKHPSSGCQAMGDLTEDDLLQIEWDQYSNEPIERYLSVNHSPETESRWTKFIAYAVYQGMLLTEEGSKQHHDQLVELLRAVYPVMLYDCWVRDYIFTESMMGLTTIHPSAFGHLNVLAETQRRKAVVIITDSILCFLNGKRSRTAYEPVQEFNVAFGGDWDFIEVKIVWGAELPRLMAEYKAAVARVNARALLNMRDPARDTPRIFGLIWWNGNDLVGRNGITPNDSTWRYEAANPDRLGTQARILGNVKLLAECKEISDELCCICGISSYLFELPSFVDIFWAEINDIIESLGIHRFQPDNLVYQSDKVDQWHMRKTQENIDRFVNYVTSIVKLSYHVNVVEASREGIAALNRVRRFKYSWDSSATVKIPESYLQLINEFVEQRNARMQQTLGKSRQFTVEEVQAYSPFETNDVSLEELKASVNLEGEDPQDVLQFINVVPIIELPEEQPALDEPMDDVATADVKVEPKVEETDADVEMPDSYTGATDEVPGPDTGIAGVNALPTAPEPDPQMAKIEAEVLDVLADDETTVEEGATGDVPMIPTDADQPAEGQASSSDPRPPLPRLRGKGQGQGTPSVAPVTGSFLAPENNDNPDLKFSGKGKGVLVRETKPNPEYKNMQVEVEEVLGRYPYPDHLLKAIGNGNIQLLEDELGRDAKQYVLYHVTGHRYYYVYEDYHHGPWEWCCSWPPHVRRGISGLLRGHVPDVSIYDPACYLPIYKLLDLAKAKFPDYAGSMNVFELISMAIYDHKDRFEFQCVYDSRVNEQLELFAAPVKIRCGQGHTDDVLETRSNEVLAVLIYCRPDHVHRYNARLTAHGNCDIPPRLYHRTHEGAARSIIASGLIPGGGAGGPKSKGNSFFSTQPLGNQKAISGVRADRPVEICFSTPDVIEAGVDLFLTNSGAVITSHHVPNTCILFATRARANAEPEVFYSRPQALDPSNIEIGVPQDDVTLVPGKVSEVRTILEGTSDATPEERTASSSAAKKEEMEANRNTAVPQIESGYFLHLRTFSCDKCTTLSLAGMASCHRCGVVFQSNTTDGPISKFMRLQMRRAKVLQEQGGVPKNMTATSMLDSIAAQDLQSGRPPARGSPSVDSQIILAARGRLRKALKSGYENVFDRFNRDDVFATSLTGEGCTAFDAAQEDLFASLQLPAPTRSAKQRSKGKSVVSDLDRLDRVDLAKLAYIRCGVDNLHTCFKQGVDENFLISYRREFMSLRQYAAVIGDSRDEIKIQGFIPTTDVYGDIHSIRIPRGDTTGIYKILSEFAEQNENYANIQYQRNAQQSASVQGRDRGQPVSQMGFMNIEQRMATPYPKFADCGQDMSSDEIRRLEEILLEFGQRGAPSPQGPVTRPPLTRKRSQMYMETIGDADKRPRLQWRRKEDRDQSGRIATWVDNRTPPPGVPQPPAPVTGTHTSSVFRMNAPPAQGQVSGKGDSSKQDVGERRDVSGKGKGQGSSSAAGSAAPAKGTPRGSVARAISQSRVLPPKRGNIPKDLLGPPTSPPPLPAPNNPPATGLSPISKPRPAKPSPPKVPPPKVPPPKIPPPKVPPNTASGIPVHTRPTDFNLTPKPPPLTDLYSRLQPSVKGKGKDKQQVSVRGGPYAPQQWNVQNVPPPPLPPGTSSASASSSHNAPLTGPPTSSIRGTIDRPLEPFDFPGVQWQRDDPWGENYWPNHMELWEWLRQGWHDETERFGIQFL